MTMIIYLTLPQHHHSVSLDSVSGLYVPFCSCLDLYWHFCVAVLEIIIIII